MQEIHAEGISEVKLLEIATYVESYSNHPIAISLKMLMEKNLKKHV